MRRMPIALLVLLVCVCAAAAADDSLKPYSAPCVERENVFAFTEKPTVKLVAKDKYEIAFAVKGNCDVTVGVVDEKGRVVRHVASGVLGANAPAPFRKNALSQKIYWTGKDDLDVYVKEPEKLKVRVMLGLKPVFDKRLGGTSPKNLPGFVYSIAAGPDGVYVFSKVAVLFGRESARKFDRDGGYLGTISPPPRLPESKYAGLGFVEYAPGKRAVHARDVNGCVSGHGRFHMFASYPIVVGSRVVYANSGLNRVAKLSLLHYIYGDGSSDERGEKGLQFLKGTTKTIRELEWPKHSDARLAASPDGKTIYVAGVSVGATIHQCVYARSWSGDEPAKVFVGEPAKPGPDNAHFASVSDIDCDAKGRLYVGDSANNRIQVFSPDGKYLKTIKIDRPETICVHKKTGALYVLHHPREKGRTVPRVTKLTSFDNPQAEFRAGGFTGRMELDSWSAEPRLWFSGMRRKRAGHQHAESRSAAQHGTGSVTIWEEQGKKFRKIADFEPEAVKEAGESWCSRWNGADQFLYGDTNSICDPTREKYLYRNRDVFDLATGKYEGTFGVLSGCFDDTSFDKRGYLHGHQNCRSGPNPCVWRVDPRQVRTRQLHNRAFPHYPEVPYDYGVEVPRYLQGAVKTKCQHGAKGFQDGMGVNMRGDIAVSSNIYYVPKMDDVGEAYAMAGSNALRASGHYNEEGGAYRRFVQSIKDKQKKGESVYFIKRKPGFALIGSTIWVYEANGELKFKSPAVVGGLINGLHLDEDMRIHFNMSATRLIGGKKFLDGRVGIFGSADKKRSAFTGTYVKADPGTLQVLRSNSIIKMEEPPTRPPDMAKHKGNIWAEHADWLYAGASPIVAGGCSCPQSRFHLDWYKRSFVPELYRHSIGILDTNGNLVMHVGSYANFDSAPGGKDGCKPGGTDIGTTAARYIGGTDNHLVFADCGDRIVVLKLDYHAEETCAINVQ